MIVPKLTRLTSSCNRSNRSSLNHRGLYNQLDAPDAVDCLDSPGALYPFLSLFHLCFELADRDGLADFPDPTGSTYDFSDGRCQKVQFDLHGEHPGPCW